MNPATRYVLDRLPASWEQFALFREERRGDVLRKVSASDLARIEPDARFARDVAARKAQGASLELGKAMDSAVRALAELRALDTNPDVQPQHRKALADHWYTLGKHLDRLMSDHRSTPAAYQRLAGDVNNEILHFTPAAFRRKAQDVREVLNLGLAQEPEPSVSIAEAAARRASTGTTFKIGRRTYTVTAHPDNNAPPAMRTGPDGQGGYSRTADVSPAPRGSTGLALVTFADKPGGDVHIRTYTLDGMNNAVDLIDTTTVSGQVATNLKAKSPSLKSGVQGLGPIPLSDGVFSVFETDVFELARDPEGHGMEPAEAYAYKALDNAINWTGQTITPPADRTERAFVAQLVHGIAQANEDQPGVSPSTVRALHTLADRFAR